MEGEAPAEPSTSSAGVEGEAPAESSTTAWKARQTIANGGRLGGSLALQGADTCGR